MKKQCKYARYLCKQNKENNFSYKLSRKSKIKDEAENTSNPQG